MLKYHMKPNTRLCGTEMYVVDRVVSALKFDLYGWYTLEVCIKLAV